ncbi:uncharacterized protein LOC126810631, partial [Patella vulgata]|uniref:uncharacterized protein LOC126810631 n=1 Tax=Patella vulgata TaxID=6465 RepID=UPI0024A909C3
IERPEDLWKKHFDRRKDNCEDVRVNSGLTDRLNRLRGDNLEFLKAVHRIMIILKSIKSKDLKSRYPLNVIPSKWLEELTERIHNLVGPEESEINVALAHLGQHSQASVKNIPQTKARLCLIVMSLPAYDICKISTQLAITFILEKIVNKTIN